MALGLLIIGTAISAYAVWSNSFANTGNDFASDTLDPPAGLGATGGASVTLDWTATVDAYASGHRVLRGTATGGPYTQIAEVTPRITTTYADSPAAGTYYYVVRAFYQNWESANSNEASATVAVTASFVSSADSFVQQDLAGTNFGTNTLMDVQSNKSGPNHQNRRSLVQFDVSSIPANSTINSATLTLCATAVPSSTRTYEAYRITATWTETTVTWSNQPSMAASATATATTPASAGCISWTLTADVQVWVNGTATNYGWLTRDQNESSAQQKLSQFRTREEATVTSERPTLQVDYTPP